MSLAAVPRRLLPVADDVIVVLVDPPTMSIYSTLWRLQFPLDDDAYTGCEWVEVFAQGVPAQVGTPTPGYGDESGDPYAAFLPPAVQIEDAPENNLRAVVFIIGTTRKGTPRAGQEYEYAGVRGRVYGASSRKRAQR